MIAKKVVIVRPLQIKPQGVTFLKNLRTYVITNMLAVFCRFLLIRWPNKKKSMHLGSCSKFRLAHPSSMAKSSLTNQQWIEITAFFCDLLADHLMSFAKACKNDEAEIHLMRFAAMCEKAAATAKQQDPMLQVSKTETNAEEEPAKRGIGVDRNDAPYPFKQNDDDSEDQSEPNALDQANPNEVATCQEKVRTPPGTPARDGYSRANEVAACQEKVRTPPGTLPRDGDSRANEVAACQEEVRTPPDTSPRDRYSRANQSDVKRGDLSEQNAPDQQKTKARRVLPSSKKRLQQEISQSHLQHGRTDFDDTDDILDKVFRHKRQG